MRMMIQTWTSTFKPLHENWWTTLLLEMTPLKMIWTRYVYHFSDQYNRYYLIILRLYYSTQPWSLEAARALLSTLLISSNFQTGLILLLIHHWMFCGNWVGPILRVSSYILSSHASLHSPLESFVSLLHQSL